MGKGKAMTRPIATALYRDDYTGWIPAALVPYRTRHIHQTVTRYRWQTERGHSCGFVSFASPAHALDIARSSGVFTEVTEVIE